MAVEQEYPQECPIWGTEADVKNQVDFYIEVNSLRAGGKYKRKFKESLEELKVLRKELADDEKVKLTDWLIERREAGEDVPVIDDKALKDAITRPEKEMSKRIEDFILFYDDNYRVNEHVNVEENAMILMAHSSSLEYWEMYDIVKTCALKGYLREVSHLHFPLTTEGKIFAEEIRKEKNQKSGQKEDEQNLQCFVAMWFDENVEGMEDVYEKAIEPAIRDAGYEAYRVDKHRHNERIDVKIIEQIDKSRFVIADFTSEEDKPRGGVYYEAGYAHGLGLKVIRTCRKDRIYGVHFDVQHYQHILWKAENLQNLQDFYDEIYLQIKEVIGDNENTKEQGFSFAGYKPKQ